MEIGTIISHLFEFLNHGILVYASLLSVSYLILGAIATKAVFDYKKKSAFTDYELILQSDISPSLSLLAPAYNEQETIIENVKSLLSLKYNNFDVIVVNDGSKDETLQRCIEHFKLEKLNYYYNPEIPTKQVRGIYKSTLPGFTRLVVVDKENGGKADAINVGINVSDARIFSCIDVDCVLDEDALLKMVHVFMEGGDERVIAAGGVVRVANDCKVEEGVVTEVNVPNSFLARIQVLEYFRAFTLGRMGWGKINGLILISGAFGFFDREIALKAGGYDHKTVGEDMELTVRMRKYMEEEGLPYRIPFIPEPLCWTEVPESNDILSRQRNRWTRGTIETLLMHKKVLFNRKYGLMGMLSFPYWLIFEWLAPLIEAAGLLYLIIGLLFGWVNMLYCLSLLGLVFAFSMFYSAMAILIEDIAFHKYRKKGAVRQLLWTAFLEPFLFHPRMTFWAVKGNYDLFSGKNTGWGEMTRKGFSKDQSKQ